MSGLLTPLAACAGLALVTLYAHDLARQHVLDLSTRGGRIVVNIVQAWFLVFGAYSLYRVCLALRRGRVPVVLLLAYLGALIGMFALLFQGIESGIWAVSGVSFAAFLVVFKRELLDPFATPFEDLDGQPYEGDWIVVHDRLHHALGEGLVTHVDARETRLIDAEGHALTIPSHILRQSIVAAHGARQGLCRFKAHLTLDAGIPLERALRVLEAGAIAAARAGGPAAVPPPTVALCDSTPAGNVYEIAYHLDPAATPRAAAHAALMASLAEHVQHAGLNLAPDSDGLSHASRGYMEKRSLESRVETLAHIEIFEGLDLDALTEIASRLKTFTYRKGQAVMREGDTGNSMFVLVEGLLQVFRKSADGEQTPPVSRLNPVYFFGEMSLLTGQPRSATVMAETDALVWEIRREDISALLIRRPEISLKIGMVAAERRMKNVIETGLYKPQDLQKQTARMVSHILAEMRAFFGAAPTA